MLTPNDFHDLAEVQHRLLDFQARYEQTAAPFDWRHTRADLDRLLRRLDERNSVEPRQIFRFRCGSICS